MSGETKFDPGNFLEGLGYLLIFPLPIVGGVLLSIFRPSGGVFIGMVYALDIALAASLIALGSAWKQREDARQFRIDEDAKVWKEFEAMRLDRDFFRDELEKCRKGKSGG